MSSKHKEVTCKELQPGDHVVFKRYFYYHHGIITDVDTDAEKVQLTHFLTDQYTAYGKGKHVTQENTFGEMDTPRDLFRVIYEEGEALPPKEVVERALEIQKENGDRDTEENQYNLLTHNCEHFATYCKTGERKSEQIENVTSEWPTVPSTPTELLNIIIEQEFLQLEMKVEDRPFAIKLCFTVEDISRLKVMQEAEAIDSEEFQNILQKSVGVAIATAAGMAIEDSLGSFAGESQSVAQGSVMNSVMGNMFSHGAEQPEYVKHIAAALLGGRHSCKEDQLSLTDTYYPTNI